MSSNGDEDDALLNEDIDTILLTLRKPTELHRVFDSVPKPARAVPKNGLPAWYKLGLDCKLPVPQFPKDKIVFSRGKIGEDVRRIKIGGTKPSFNLSDPHCLNVSYEYAPVHDPHLDPHFKQPHHRARMVTLGFVAKDGRAVCSLKEFNQYRKFLYSRYMDKIREELKALDERAQDELLLRRVERDLARRQLAFNRAERAREHKLEAAQARKDEWAEKKRIAKEREKKVKDRIRYLADFKEKQKTERAAKAKEKEDRIKQRLQAAAELELRRKITMIREWRSNERKRLKRLQQEKEQKAKLLEENANNKWEARIEAQNKKIELEAKVLKMYCDDIKAAAERRTKRAEVQAYNADLAFQRIKLTNLKAIHGGAAKEAKVVKKMGSAFEKSARGTRGMTMERAQDIANEAMKQANSVDADRFTNIGQAKKMMDESLDTPAAPAKLLDEIMDSAIREYSRRHINNALRKVENAVKKQAGDEFLSASRQNVHTKRGGVKSRWAKILENKNANKDASKTGKGEKRESRGLSFGPVSTVEGADTLDPGAMKSAKGRTPTPVPSKTMLVDVAFKERDEDLPDPVAHAGHLPERNKLANMVRTASKLLVKNVKARVNKGLDVTTGEVTLPSVRHPMEWGEAVEGLAGAVVESRVGTDCGDLRRTGDFLASRILKTLNADMKAEKKKKKSATITSDKQDFYIPDPVGNEK
ncbi:hypothetical protein JYU34_003216 [Plutella xylostella]|uniref:Fibrous sheath-interacting protein 2 n=1 Tax=Plutella xylostella TaxID=51655 RepID=A0ABQ7QZH4_PLUXY|nr:hypothetical protein JYU34_003216 [Plutella xylostella]